MPAAVFSLIRVLWEQPSASPVVDPFAGELFEFGIRVQIFRFIITVVISIYITLKWGNNNYIINRKKIRGTT